MLLEDVCDDKVELKYKISNAPANVNPRVSLTYSKTEHLSLRISNLQ